MGQIEMFWAPVPFCFELSYAPLSGGETREGNKRIFSCVQNFPYEGPGWSRIDWLSSYPSVLSSIVPFLTSSIPTSLNFGVLSSFILSPLMLSTLLVCYRILWAGSILFLSSSRSIDNYIIFLPTYTIQYKSIILAARETWVFLFSRE